MLRVILFAALFCLGTAPVLAGSATGQFGVSVTVVDSCAVGASDMTFGNYTAGAQSPVASVTTLSTTCSNLQPYTVSINGGSTTGQVANRAMSDGASHTLRYGLYADAGYSSIVGDGTAGSVVLTNTGTGARQSLTIYGRIPNAQFVAAGTYTDRLTLTLAF